MMASFLSHQQHHVQNVMVEVGKEAEEASRALEQLNEALQMNSSKIQRLTAELEATQLAASKYSASLPHAARVKARMDERLRELRDTAERVKRELAAEKLVQEYLEELRKDDEDSEMRLKKYLNEVMKRDAEGYGDSDSETEWSMLESSVESLKKPLASKAPLASAGSIVASSSSKQQETRSEIAPSEAEDEPEPMEQQPAPIKECTLPQPTPGTPSPKPEQNPPSSPPVEQVIESSTAETASEIPEPVGVPATGQPQTEAPPQRIETPPPPVGHPEITSPEPQIVDKEATQPSQSIYVPTPAEVACVEEAPAVVEAESHHPGGEDGDEAEDEDSGDEEDEESGDDEPNQIHKETPDLCASVRDAAILSATRTATPPQATMRAISPPQVIRSPPINSPTRAALTPRSFVPPPMPPPIVASPTRSSSSTMHSPPLVKPTPVRYPAFEASSPPPPPPKHDVPTQSGGLSLYEHAKRMTSKPSRSADFGTIHSSIHAYPPPLPVHAPDAHCTIPPTDAPSSGPSRDAETVDTASYLASSQSRLLEIQRRLAAARELRNGSVPMPSNATSPRSPDQDPIAKPKSSRDLPPTPTLRTSYPRGDYLSSSSGGSTAEIFSYYSTGGTPPLKTIKKNSLGLHEDKSHLYMANFNFPPLPLPPAERLPPPLPLSSRGFPRDRAPPQ